MSDGKGCWFYFMQSNHRDDSFRNGVKCSYIKLSDEEHKANLCWVDWENSEKIKVCFKRFSRQSDLLEELKYVKLMSLRRPKCRLHLYRDDHILKQQERDKTRLVCDILLIGLLLQIADSVAQYFHWKHILMVLTANHFNLPHHLLAA